MPLVNKIVNKIPSIQKEQNRINSHYFGQPDINIENDIDTVEDLWDYIINDTHKFNVYIENLARDFFDYEREIADEEFRASIRGENFAL